MMTWLSGFLQFRAWLPEPLLAAVDPDSVVDPLHVRTLLALAVAAFLWSFAARTLWGIALFFVDRVQRRRLVMPVATPLSWLAWLIGVVAAALPWVALWQTARLGHIPWNLVTASASLALVWAILRSTERSRLYLLPAQDCLVVTRALPGLRTAEHRIPLDLLLPFAGPDAADPVQRDIARFLTTQLGSDRAVARYVTAIARKRRRAT